MSLILNIETSTKKCSASLSEEGKLIALREIAESNFSHIEKLHIFIDELLKESNHKFHDLKAIAVSQGPGSYTGLRIGVSAAKGLCYALDIPLIAIDTLEILARQIQIKEGILIPLLDARRMEVYTAVFNSSYQLIEKTKALVIEKDSFSDYLDLPVHFLGDGVLKCKEVLKKSNFIFHEDHVFPSAKEMISMSYDKYKNNEFVDVAYFEPFYLKDFVMTTKKK